MLTLQDIVQEPLGNLALRLRSMLEPAKLESHICALATCLDRTPDRSYVSFSRAVNQASGIMVNPWSKCDCYDQDFGLGLGLPVAVRRPRFVPYESLTDFMPKAPDGEIVVVVCLRSGDLEQLEADTEFLNYGRVVG